MGVHSVPEMVEPGEGDTFDPFNPTLRTIVLPIMKQCKEFIHILVQEGARSLLGARR